MVQTIEAGGAEGPGMARAMKVIDEHAGAIERDENRTSYGTRILYYIPASGDEETIYEVVIEPVASCTCPHFMNRSGGSCKHIMAGMEMEARREYWHEKIARTRARSRRQRLWESF